MLYAEKDDGQLVHLYSNGDEMALEQLIRRHKDRIFLFIVSKVRDHALAEDLFQDTFVKVINTIKRNKYNEEGKFIQWTMRVAHNLVIDHFRREKKHRKVQNSGDFNIITNLKDDALNAENQLIKDQIESDAAGLLEYLPNEQKKVLVMRIYEDMSFKDIADQTGVSINTALGRMRYALINLRKIISEHNIVLHKR
ncbi:MAG: sigma-70 family RNA polymerase sigma factor [Cryomorphaceae bacterium]|nr:sigma-70 family RNA polymerase sigma factor [Cryomorphaceae bacterium]